MRRVSVGLTRALIAIAIAAGALAMPAARAADMTSEEARTAVQNALGEKTRGNIDGVIPLLDPVIAAFEAMRAKAPSFCAENNQQTLIILLGAAVDAEKGKARKQSGSTFVVDGAYCTALFVKGFVLIDTGHPAEAEGFLRQAHETAPYNAHFLNEYAEWYKTAGQWQRSHDLFAQALELAEMANDVEKGPRKARALRGMGYAEIELGKLNDAERHMRESQKYEPDSRAAKSELDYITSLRRRQSN